MAMWLRGLLWNEDGGPFSSSRLRKLPYVTVAIPLFFVHVALAQLGWSLLSGATLVPVWPDAGLDLVALLLFGTRFWPVLLAAYLATTFARPMDWMVGWGISLANVFRTLVAVWLFKAISKKRNFLGLFEEVAAISGAAVLAPIVSSGICTIVLILGGKLHEPWVVFWSRWWIGDALGALCMTPVLLGLGKFAGGLASFGDRKVFGKTVLLAAAVVAGCYFVFFRLETSNLLFSVFLLILLSAAWVGPPAARISALVIAAAAVWATHIGVGAFAGGTDRENLQNLNLFLAAVSLTGLAVGAFRSSGSLLLPGSVLVAGWVVSGWLYASLDRDRVNYDEARFDKLVNSVESRMHSRLANYEDVLRGGAGFIAATDHLDPQNWHSYVDRLRNAGSLSRHHRRRVYPMGAGRATRELCRRAASPGPSRFSGTAYAWRASSRGCERPALYNDVRRAGQVRPPDCGNRPDYGTAAESRRRTGARYRKGKPDQSRHV